LLAVHEPRHIGVLFANSAPSSTALEYGTRSDHRRNTIDHAIDIASQATLVAAMNGQKTARKVLRTAEVPVVLPPAKARA
jgi:hypothetical protein